MKFTKIPADTFSCIQLNAGIIVDSFTPSTGEIGNILGATTGGIQLTATPSFTDFASDIDNAAKNMKEFKRLDQWEVKMSGTFAAVSSDLANSLVAAGKLSGRSYAPAAGSTISSKYKYYTRSGESPNYIYTLVSNPTADNISSYYVRTRAVEKITPSNELELTSFMNLWWVGDYSDLNGATNGGFCAFEMLNALSTGGFQIKSGDKAKGQYSFEYTAHYSNENPDTVPFNIYLKQGNSEPAS